MFRVNRKQLKVIRVASFYQLANIFKLSHAKNKSLHVIERYFSLVVDSENFTVIGYSVMSRILKSSELFITSEIEVFRAADN